MNIVNEVIRVYIYIYIYIYVKVISNILCVK